MHPFASYVLRSYYKATGWNEDNLYANLTRSSNGKYCPSRDIQNVSDLTRSPAILDFTVPRGLHLSISKSPNALFKTTYSMTAMPSLNGSVGYIFTSCDLDAKASGNVRFKDMIERFKVYDQPRRPEGKEEEWLGGEKVDTRGMWGVMARPQLNNEAPSDYLLYGRFYLPTGRLDALYSTRLTPTLQAMVAAISDPPSNVPGEMRGRGGDVSNIMLNLQHDVGKWCTEYTWSAEDAMWGVRVLHNFGRLGAPVEISEEGDRNNSSFSGSRRGLKRVDEEDAVEGGLKGRVSVGAEFYFSAKEKSAGGQSSALYLRNLPTVYSYSVDRNPIYDPPRCYTTLIPITVIFPAVIA